MQSDIASNRRNRIESNSVSSFPTIPRAMESDPIEKKTSEPSSSAITKAAPNNAQGGRHKLNYIYFNDNARKLLVRERTYDVHLATSKSIPYEPLLDNGLADFFNTPNTRRHLIRQGFIDHNGKMVDRRRYKDNQIWLDACEKEVKNRKVHEKKALDREVEVTIRRSTAERPPSAKYVGGRRKGDERKPSEYPVLLRTTAKLYAHPNPMLEKARRIFAQSRKTILENHKEKITRSRRPNLVKNAGSNNASRKDSKNSRAKADGRFRGGTNVSFASLKQSNNAISQGRSKKVVNRGTETDATDHRGLRFVRPHSAPPRRGQIVTRENDWSESELGDSSRASSMAATRPASARATGWPWESEECDLDDFDDFEAQQSEEDSEDEQQNELFCSENAQENVRQNRRIGTSQDRAKIQSEYHAGHRLAISLLDSNQLTNAEAQLRQIAEALPDPSKKIMNPLLRNLVAKVQLTLAKTLYRMGGREEEWTECVERAIELGGSNLKLLESISQFEEEVIAAEIDRPEITDAANALKAEGFPTRSIGDGNDAVPNAEPCVVNRDRNETVTTRHEGTEADTRSSTEGGDQSGYETDFDVGDNEEKEVDDDSSIGADIRSSFESFKGADEVLDEGDAISSLFDGNSNDLPNLSIIEKTPEIFDPDVNSVARSQHASIIDSDGETLTVAQSNCADAEAARSLASNAAAAEMEGEKKEGIPIEKDIVSPFSRQATEANFVSVFSRQATGLEDSVDLI